MGAPLGNKNGSKNKLWEQALVRAVRPKDLEDVAKTVIQAAKDGQPWAVTELGNRLDGKAVQQVDMSGNLNMTRTVRDLTDDELARVVLEARAGKEPDTDGQTLQ